MLPLLKVLKVSEITQRNKPIKGNINTEKFGQPKTLL